MNQAPPGWYPDPAPEAQATPGRLRYWNGAAWTAHVSQPEPPHPQPHAQQQPYQPQHHRPPPTWGPGAPPHVRTTPDGQRLAGWWARVGATLLDAVVLLPLSALFVVPIVSSQWDELTRYFEDAMRAVEQGAPPPPDPAVFQPGSGPGLLLVASSLVLSAVYYLAFWRWKQATPGKLLVGLRIRRRAQPGPMPWSAMLARFAFVNVLAVASNFGPLALVFGLALLVDYLWPLWDDRNQALHDKVAGTNVVVRGR